VTTAASFFFLLGNGRRLFDLRFLSFAFLLVFAFVFGFAFAVGSFRAVGGRLLLPLLFALLLLFLLFLFFLLFALFRFGGDGGIVEGALIGRFRLDVLRLGFWTRCADDGESLDFGGRAGGGFQHLPLRVETAAFDEVLADAKRLAQLAVLLFLGFGNLVRCFHDNSSCFVCFVSKLLFVFLCLFHQSRSELGQL